MIELRPYQAKLDEEVRAAFAAGAGSVCLQLGTGGGKTATSSVFLSRVVASGYRAMFCARLDTLIEDTHAKLAAAGVPAGFVQAGRPSDPTAPVQVCSLATLHARGEAPPADLVVIDECQCAQGPTVRALLDRYPRANLLGLTATPQRGDGKPLGDVFRRLICGPSNKWLTSQGYLVPVDVLAPGDGYQAKGLAMDPVAAYEEHANGTRAIVFAANVEHAKDLYHRFNERGHACEYVIGETSRKVRQGVRDRLRWGELKVLVGVGVFIEGWDEPSVETCILARAFGVTGAFLQAIGRVLRPWKEGGKTRALVIDLRGAVFLHGLPDEDRIWSITGRAVRRAEQITALQKCRACLAIFRPASKCPRCGAKTVGMPKIPRALTRFERLENFSQLTQLQRDAMYLAGLQRIAVERVRLSGARADQWALSKFKKQFGRTPEGIQE